MNLSDQGVRSLTARVLNNCVCVCVGGGGLGTRLFKRPFMSLSGGSVPDNSWGSKQLIQVFGHIDSGEK